MSPEFLPSEELWLLWKDHPNSRVLFGIDWGTKRLGLSISDRSGLIASPLGTFILAKKECQGHQEKIGKKQGSTQRATQGENQTLGNVTLIEKAASRPQESREKDIFSKNSNGSTSDDVLMEKDKAPLQKRIQEKNPLAIIMGLPKNMNGSLGFQSQRVLLFAEVLAKIVEYPIFFQDERWSSSAVERLLIHADITRQKRKKVLDSLASAYMLQSVLDCLNRRIS
jgi:putative Holliday junction resolvase